jgi:hypothetical protein
MDDDFQLQGYQDDLDTDPTIIDDVTHDATDQLYDTRGVPLADTGDDDYDAEY